MSDALNVYAMLTAYKIATLLAGLALAYMGYRLFLADKSASAGELTGSGQGYELSLRGAAPGIFFSLFGTIVICVSLFRGVSYEDTQRRPVEPEVEFVLPETPPT